MKLFLRRNAPLFYALAAMLALYIPWLNRGFNNFEYPFVSAGRALAFSYDSNLIESYWASVANPLGYPLLLSMFYRFFGFSDAFWVSRLPALVGIVLILFAGWLMTKNTWREKRYLFYFWSALVVLQPMIAVFSTSGTTDILPVGLLMISIAIAVKNEEISFLNVLSIGVIFGIAVIVKYNTAYFGLALVSSSLIYTPSSTWQKYRKIPSTLIYILIPGTILCVYLFWCYSRFGIFISAKFETSEPHFFDLVSLSKNLAKYLAFFGMFCGVLPLTVIFANEGVSRLRARWIAIVAVLALIGWFSSGLSLGEMDYGRFFEGRYLFLLRIIETVGFILGVFSIISMFMTTWLTSRIKITILSGLIPYLFLISASYPSQRYLTFAIPGALLLLTDATQRISLRLGKLFVGVTALGFAAVSLLGMSYLTSQGNASEEMAVWVEENDLISQTSVGAISPHAGQHFWGVKTTELRYEIIAVTPENESQIKERVLHREPMKVLGKVTRVYLLREIPAAP